MWTPDLIISADVLSVDLMFCCGVLTYRGHSFSVLFFVRNLVD